MARAELERSSWRKWYKFEISGVCSRYRIIRLPFPDQVPIHFYFFILNQLSYSSSDNFDLIVVCFNSLIFLCNCFTYKVVKWPMGLDSLWGDANQRRGKLKLFEWGGRGGGLYKCVINASEICHADHSYHAHTACLQSSLSRHCA